LNWIAAGGTLLLIAGLITIPVVSISLAARAYVTTLKQLMWAILTVVTVLALVHVMNEAGQTITLGAGRRAGGIFAFIGPMIGWLGVGVTGSDRSSNSMFGALQVTAAKQSGLSPILMAAANTFGGVLGT
jgi:lactate permease